MCVVVDENQGREKEICVMVEENKEEKEKACVAVVVFFSYHILRMICQQR